MLAQSWGPWPPGVTFHPAGTPHSPLLRKQRAPVLSAAVSNYFFFLPLQNKHLSIRCIFKEMDQHGYSGRHKAHWGVGRIPNLRKSRSLYINHTFTIIGRRLNSLSVRATLALLGTFGGAPQTLSSCIHFLPWLLSFIADFILIRQEEEEEETENCKLIS